jgi:hypothetical protein
MKNDNTTFYLTLVAFGFLGLILYLSLKEKSQPKALGELPEGKKYITKEEILKILAEREQTKPEREYVTEF